MQELSVPSPQFSCEPKTALKKKVYPKKKKIRASRQLGKEKLGWSKVLKRDDRI